MIIFNHNKLTEARWKKGWTRKTLAKIADLSESTVGAIERGLANNPSSVKKIADVLDLKMEDLLVKPKAKKEA